MVAITLSEGLGAVLVGEIDAVLDRKRRELGAHVVPFRLRREAEPPAPLLRDSEGIGEILELECGIPRFARRVIFLRGDHRRAEDIVSAIEMREGGEKICGLEDD